MTDFAVVKVQYVEADEWVFKVLDGLLCHDVPVVAGNDLFGGVFGGHDCGAYRSQEKKALDGWCIFGAAHEAQRAFDGRDILQSA